MMFSSKVGYIRDMSGMMPDVCGRHGNFSRQFGSPVWSFDDAGKIARQITDLDNVPPVVTGEAE
jgi:hypothetical protein